MSAYDDLILATSSLVAYWKCEELVPPTPAPNSDFIDSSGSIPANNGTLQPAATAGLVQGLTGPILTDSVSYGMSGGIARIPSLGDNVLPIFLTAAQTWECWAKRSGSGDVEMMMNRGSDATNTYLSFAQRSTGLFSGCAITSLEWGLQLRGLVSCVLEPDVWHLIHMTYNGVDTMNLYVDSWLVDTRSDCPPAPLTDTNPWRMGYAVNLVFGAIYRSQGLSHIAIYNDVLTPSQIINRAITALGSRPNNPCGLTPILTVGCPDATGVVGEPYSSTITVSGGTPPYTFSIFSGALPDGLVLDSVTGAITGTPTVANPFNFVIEVIDADFNVGFSSGCQIVISEIPPPSGPNVETHSFGQGTKAAWWIVPQITDSGDNLRDKTDKSVIVTGKMTDPRFSVYKYQPQDSIDVTALERGTGSATGKKHLRTTTQVQRTARKQLNVANAMLSTWRLEGIWDGSDGSDPDRVDECVVERASQGIRR